MPSPRMITFKVRGRGNFPIDMLRYDSAWPTSAEDAAKITDSFGQFTRAPGERRAPWEISLTSIVLAPTIGRWESFNVKVID